MNLWSRVCVRLADITSVHQNIIPISTAKLLSGPFGPWIRPPQSLLLSQTNQFSKADIEFSWVISVCPQCLPSVSVSCPKCQVPWNLNCCCVAFSLGKAGLGGKGTVTVSHMHGLYSRGAHRRWLYSCAESRVISCLTPLLFIFGLGIVGHIPFLTMHPCSGPRGSCFSLLSLCQLP